MAKMKSIELIVVEVACFSSWRETSRQLLEREISPDSVSWSNDCQGTLDFSVKNNYLDMPVLNQKLNVPLEFMCLAKDVACFRGDQKWALLYSVAWRLVFEDRNLLDFKLDSQVKELCAMRKAIGRDRHKMEAFLRFKQVDNLDCTDGISSDQDIALSSSRPGDEQFIAWFEPDHLILASVVPFFINRFSNMKWSILTPDVCAHWDFVNVAFSPGIPKTSLCKDSVEDLWLEYYASIFNPARLKLKAMQSEMPKKYWANLPEAPLIPQLTRKAHQSMTAMIEKKPTHSWSKTSRSRFVRKAQHTLQTKSSLVDLHDSE